jgi:hypothetical protein
MRKLSLTIVAVTALSAVVVSGCKRTPPAPTAKVEERVVKAIDGRCPTVLDATREGGLDADRYVVPTDAERHAIRDAVAILVEGAPDAMARATTAAKAASFEIVDVPEQGAVLLREARTKRGGGAYLVRVGSKAHVFIQAPHTFYDEGTLPLGCELFERARAGAFFINTSHRYKSAKQTSGGQFPADVAHAKDSLFQAATEGLLRARPKPSKIVVVQVHGFGEREAGGNGAMVLSAGVRTPGQPVVARVALALSRVIDGGVLRFPEDHNELGATTNVQGAIVRESGGQFLHIEMGAPLRRDLLGNPTVRANVLATLADAMEGA